MSGFEDYKVKKAAKTHRCEVCTSAIYAGGQYMECSGVDDGHWFRYRYHLACQCLLAMVYENHHESVLEGNNPDELVMYELEEVTLEEVRAACEGLDSVEVARACMMWRDIHDQRQA